MIGTTHAELTSQLGVDLNSPVSWLHYPGKTSPPPKPYYSFQDGHSSRDLESNDEYTDLLVDEDGNSYEPYSLAWRYLGVFIDCDKEEEEKVDDDSGEERRRHLSSSDDGRSGCARKVLWAAYRDPEYSGGSIGEYQYYNISTGEYDSEYCRSERCVPLDCHDPNTHFELVGVFKETDGLEDFAEQLFKHEGYCIWDYDTYSLMSTYREFIPNTCTKLHFPDDNGNTLYMDVRPKAKGDITIGVYTDDMCLKNAKLSIEDYIQMFYEASGDAEKGQKIARAWTKAIRRWNKHMSIYKQCQPCRAYNLANGDDGNSGSGDRLRFLEEQDGAGDDEQWGYDCYDDAGYTNCNQCYKFQSKTRLEQADIDDLKLASQQGTILDIRVEGKRYGRGGYFKPFPRLSKFIDNLPQWAIILMGVAAGLFVIGVSVFTWRRLANSKMLGTFFAWVRDRFHRQDLPNSFKEHFHIEDDKTMDIEDADRQPLSYVYE